MSTPAEIINLLKPKIQRGLENAADHLLSESIEWIPISRGALRASAEVKTTRKGVSLEAGKGLPYGTKQYFGKLRRKLKAGRPTRLLDGFTGATGRTDESRYASAYRGLRKRGQLRRPAGLGGALRWFDRAFTKETQREMRTIFIKTFNA